MKESSVEGGARWKKKRNEENDKKKYRVLSIPLSPFCFV